MEKITTALAEEKLRREQKQVEAALLAERETRAQAEKAAAEEAEKERKKLQQKIALETEQAALEKLKREQKQAEAALLAERETRAQAEKAAAEEVEKERKKLQQKIALEAEQAALEKLKREQTVKQERQDIQLANLASEKKEVGRTPPPLISSTEKGGTDWGCTVNGRLKFRDGSNGCLTNYPLLLNWWGPALDAYRHRQNVWLALSINPAQCPVAAGASWGSAGPTTAINFCNGKLQKIIGSSDLGCVCWVVDDIAKSMSKQEFGEFERAYAARIKAGVINDAGYVVGGSYVGAEKPTKAE